MVQMRTVDIANIRSVIDVLPGVMIPGMADGKIIRPGELRSLQVNNRRTGGEGGGC